LRLEHWEPLEAVDSFEVGALGTIGGSRLASRKTYGGITYDSQ
jgi:hypothetical protein